MRLAMSLSLDRGSFQSFRHREPGWRSWLAREIHNLEVAGSIPAPGTFCHNTLLWRSWQRFGLMSRWSRVRAPAGADFVTIFIGWMAEWSKALVLGTSLFGGVGSNPTSVTILDLAFKRKAAPAGARTLDHRLIRPMRCQLRHKSISV